MTRNTNDSAGLNNDRDGKSAGEFLAHIRANAMDETQKGEWFE